MKHVPIALLIFVAPAFAEELPVNPAVTQATIGRTICKPDWTKAVRPPLRVMDQIKRDKLRAAGWADADKSRFELDYIIPLSLGGRRMIRKISGWSQRMRSWRRKHWRLAYRAWCVRGD